MNIINTQSNRNFVEQKKKKNQFHRKKQILFDREKFYEKDVDFIPTFEFIFGLLTTFIENNW